ncbi:MAG TPA: MgtC/SapB family protein [Bacteroidia bacterium]|jgi:putative Mg2+ transporter-C (MgtC) family protein
MNYQDLSIELIIVLKLLFALLLGGIIGLDRERHGKDAGIRTYAAVCVGSAIFTCIGNLMIEDVTAGSRIIANIITGVGFLGAGIIYRNDAEGSASGLTTAATVWCTAALGVAVGLNMFIIAVTGTLVLYFLLSLQHHKWYLKWKAMLAEKDRTGKTR